MKIDGHCHCGFIAYEAEVNPETVYVCHCTDCQSISGSPYRWAVSIPEADFTLLSGEPKSYAKQAASGRTSLQMFCPHCASPIYSTTAEAPSGAGPKRVNVRLGTARQRDQLKPRKELWCGAAQDWATIEGETEKLAQQ